jgi:uncharacterized membrane protein HdeD (DUF308 family)
MALTDPTPPPPPWLVRLTVVSIFAAALALGAPMWSRWGLVTALAIEVWKYCF